MIPVLAIDPGASGGLAWIDRDGVTQTVPMPEGMSAQADIIRELAARHTGLICFIEKTGTARPTDAKPAAVKFARHCGHLEGVCYVLAISTTQIAPSVWQKALGALPKDKPDRKRAIKELMARSHPAITVTLKTADALGLLNWALKNLPPHSNVVADNKR